MALFQLNYLFKGLSPNIVTFWGIASQDFNMWILKVHNLAQNKYIFVNYSYIKINSYLLDISRITMCKEYIHWLYLRKYMHEYIHTERLFETSFQ